LVKFTSKEIEMPMYANTTVENPADVIVTPKTADTGKIRLGGASRLPVKTLDSGKIRLGGASRLPIKAA
jgi:hypothetical protein